MKKLLPTSATRPSFIYIQSARAKAYVLGVLILLASCTSTQVRWDAVKMRQDVMVYYNDQIMENLIRAKKHLPFVHVDISSLTSSGASQITGSVGYGETTTNTGTRVETNQNTITNTSTSPGPVTTHTVASIIGGLLATATNTAMRPFSYSVSPTRSETLTITAAPALGAQAVASPAPTGTPTMTVTKTTKTTDITDPNSPKLEKCTEEKTLTPAAQPPPRTIYDLYQDFADNHLSEKSEEPKKGRYVPGTLKKWSEKGHTKYYFVADNEKRSDKDDYYKFCKQLFTKAQTGSLEQKVQELSGRIETFQAAPVPP